MKSTGTYSDNINRLKEEIKTADAIVIGAGAGLSTSAGFTYSGDRFEKNFADFHRKYGITDMYSGGFYPFDIDQQFVCLPYRTDLLLLSALVHIYGKNVIWFRKKRKSFAERFPLLFRVR